MPTAYTNRPTLNFDSPEPIVTADPNASALFPSQPVYARTPKKKASGNLPLMVGAPVLAIVAGGLVWMAMGDRADTPTDPQSLQTAAADIQPAPGMASSETAATPIPQPTELAANEAGPTPAPVAREVTPRASPPTRAPARRVAATPIETSAPDVSTASSNVSATVPATPPTVSAPTIAEPPPLVIPAPAAPLSSTPSSPEPTTSM